MKEIHLEKCDFLNFRNSVTLNLTLDRVKVILVPICIRGLHTHTKLDRNLKKFLWTDGRTYVQT